MYQFTTNCGVSADCGADAVELVEGVENMQILYGEDTTNDGVINAFVTADDVSNYANVKSVKIGLIMRSPDTVISEVDSSTLTYTLMDSITIDPPDDNFLRYVSNSTIYLRNTGL